MDCIVNVYKEAGWTSFDVVRKLRSILHERKIGHTGTLDPMAEGVLVVCSGTACKLVDTITGTEKVYETSLRLGLETDTEDITGKLIDTSPVLVSEQEFREAVQSMVGTYQQIPPMYSAKKVGGRRLYSLAREGLSVERKPQEITVYEISIEDLNLPEAKLRIRTSKGSYIRTICADIGRKLGCGAVMTSLKRTAVGGFTIEESHRISELQEASKEGRLMDLIMPPMYVDEPTALCFGKFDGGHLGHQLIFENVFHIAKEKGLKTVLLTFSQNPDAVVKGEHKPGISTRPEHLSRLRNYGFDYVFSFPMTKETMRISAEDFLKNVLVEALHVKEIVAGRDCSFGYKAKGNAALLESYASHYGYNVHILEKLKSVSEDGKLQEISSTLIKSEIESGNVERVKELLGRYFSISGIVVHGKNIGGSVLSFPTANILPSEGKSIPKPGVYATRVLLDQKFYPGMSNVGNNPTVSGDNPIDIETHILDFDGYIYDSKIRVEFVEWIREQRKFPSMEALKEQLIRDREEVRRVLSEKGLFDFDS